MSEAHGYTDSGAPPPPTTNYSSISHPSGHPQGQNGNRNGYAASDSGDEPTPWIRFFKALGGAVLVALLAGLLFESIYLATERRAWEKVHLPEGYDLPSGLSVHQCASGSAWSDMSPADDDAQGSQKDKIQYPGYGGKRPFPPMIYPFAANTSFDVPLGSGNDDDDSFLTVLSRGRWLTGNVNFVGSWNQERGKARVEVVVRHLREDTREQLRACLIERDDGGKGIGIFTPEHEWHWQGDSRRRQVDYEVNVLLPADYNQKRLVKRLETDLPNASQNFRYAFTMRFDEVVLKGSNGYIYATPGLTAKRVVVNVTDSSVAGIFTVTEHLGIHSSSGDVWARVWAKHSPGLEQGPTIDLQTSNGSLESQIHLVPYSSPLAEPPLPSPPHIPEYGVAPQYDIQARTSRGRLSVDVVSEFEKDVKPTIHLNGTNTHGGAVATVYHTYSGTYDLQTHFQGAAQLQLRCTQVVPILCSNGYTRDYREITSQGHLKGEVEWVSVLSTPMSWGDEEEKGAKKKSSVVLNTWGGPAVLTI